MCSGYTENEGGNFTQSLSRLKTPHTYQEAMKRCITYIIELSAESKADLQQFQNGWRSRKGKWLRCLLWLGVGPA